MEVGGESLEDPNDHGFLLFAGKLSEVREPFDFLVDAFGRKALESSAHGAERLRKIVNDAMEKDFFLLDFAKKLLMHEGRVSRSLE